ncbi:MAG: DUF1572 family protein [Planctomycetaceae bacterium]|nr:DUF1572 family protein [Planctomycetaceae bacterium]
MYPEELTLPHAVDPSTEPSLAAAVTHAASAELADALATIEHCIAQLSDEQVWHRQGEGLNSIGNLLLHLTGNLRQWAIAGLTGAADERRRLEEFRAQGGISRDELVQSLRTCVAEARQILPSVRSEELLRVRTVQGFAVSGIAALWHTVAHFRGHTQEIIGMTRLLLGKAYRFQWVPKTAEQGA